MCCVGTAGGLNAVSMWRLTQTKISLIVEVLVERSPYDCIYIQDCVETKILGDGMIPILLSGLVTALSLLVVDLIVPGVRLDTVTAAAIAATSIGVVNAFVKPVLGTLSAPVNLLTFGLFSYVVNGLCLWLSSLVVPGFQVSGILGFLLGPVVLSFVGTFLGKYLGDQYPQLMEGAPTNDKSLLGKSDLTVVDQVVSRDVELTTTES